MARNKKIVDNYDLILSAQKKDDEALYKITSKNNEKNTKNRDINHARYTQDNVQETIENFKKVKRIIDAESKETRKIKKKKKKKMNKKLKHFIIFNVVILIILIICAVLMLTLPFFNLEEVYFSSENEYDIEEFSKTLGITTGNNTFITLFKVNKESMKEKYPYVESIDLNYSFPNKIGITVNARSKRYYAYNKENNMYYTLSESGYILEEMKDTSMWKDEILVSGITFENSVVIGTRINDIDYEKITNFEKYYKVITETIENVKITKVKFENAYMKIYINSSVYVIFKVADSPEKYNINVLKLILKDIGESKGTIDMTKENPTFVKN